MIRSYHWHKSSSNRAWSRGQWPIDAPPPFPNNPSIRENLGIKATWIWSIVGARPANNALLRWWWSSNFLNAAGICSRMGIFFTTDECLFMDHANHFIMQPNFAIIGKIEAPLNCVAICGKKIALKCCQNLTITALSIAQTWDSGGVGKWPSFAEHMDVRPRSNENHAQVE